MQSATTSTSPFRRWNRSHVNSLQRWSWMGTWPTRSDLANEVPFDSFHWQRSIWLGIGNGWRYILHRSVTRILWRRRRNWWTRILCYEQWYPVDGRWHVFGTYYTLCVKSTLLRYLWQDRIREAVRVLLRVVAEAFVIPVQWQSIPRSRS